MDPTPWNLLHDGRIVALSREGTRVRMEVAAGHVVERLRADARSMPLVVHLEGVAQLAYTPYDEAELTDPDAIVRARPDIVEAVVASDELVVWGSRGSLRLRYDALSLELDVTPVTIDALAAAVNAFWEAWRQTNALPDPHPLVREALNGRWSTALFTPLLEAWRRERTSDLADVLDALDRVSRSGPQPTFDTVASLANFSAVYARDPGAALDALIDCAFATFDLLMADDPGPGSPKLGAWLDARRAERARWWAGMTRAVATLRDEPPDPRIGYAVIAMLRSPSDHWFHLDQVAHVAGPFIATTDAPSFADHAFALIETHADAGTPEQLEHRAKDVSIEADCNGAAMADSLRELATTLKGRYPHDRALPEAARTALRHRPLDP